MPEAKKHDNQYTSPPITAAEAIRKAKTLLVRTAGKGPRGQDRMTRFADWLHSDPKEFPNVGTWMKAQGLHPTTLQKWGGRMFWNESREAVRAEALARTIAKVPDVIAKKYEKELSVSMKLVEVIDKYAERLKKDPEPPAPLPENPTEEQKRIHAVEMREYKSAMRQVPAESINILAEAVSKLAETNMKISGDAPKEGGPAFNFQMIVSAVQRRDEQRGVPPDQVELPAK